LAADDDLGPIGGIKIGGGRAVDAPPIVAEYAAHRRRARRGGLFSKLVLTAILIAAVGFFLAPWFALQAVRSAAESHDSQALNDLIDYNAVRAGLSAQMSGAPAHAPIDPWTHPLEAMREVLSSGVRATPSVEAYLTPEALNAMLNGRAPNAPVTSHPWPVLRYWGFDRCRMTVTDPSDPQRQTLLTFQRHGWYTWKLSQIRLPG
jgi:hypothetical protein